MNCKVCGRPLRDLELEEQDGVHGAGECWRALRAWVLQHGKFFPDDTSPRAWGDPRWLVTIDAYLEAHPPQREE